ncbi:MAG TPA: hypothetical protein ENK54_01655 [Thiotrichales bacterium]|nr:hypothetical protein [Thiotrichales bacterium]
MALRIKSRWTEKAKVKHSDELLDENAQALAFIFWRLALDKAKNLHGEKFIYEDDRQRVYVIGEYLAMLLQVADRWAYLRLEEEDRARFINRLARRLADHMQDNAEDLFGPGDFRTPFIAMLNVRGEGYAEFDFTEEGPSYGFLHFFGTHVQKVMSDEYHDNRWVIDQVMEIDGPETIDKAVKAMEDLFS